MPDPKTVLHIITGLEDAGAEGALYRLITQDPGTRHVVISLSGAGKYGPMLEEAGIELHCMHTTPQKLITSLKSLTALIKKISPDAVQTWMYEADVFGGLAARMAGIKNLHWSIRFSTVDMKGVPRKMKWAIRASIPLARVLPKTIISCAHKAVDEHVKLGYPRAPWRVVHNGYDFSRTDFSQSGRVRIREEFGIPSTATVVGMVARFDPQKDYTSLLKAFTKVSKKRDFHLLLVGRGVDCDPEMDNLVAATGLEHKIHRAGSRPDIADIFSAMDVHVLASRFGEGFPNVVAEAMACGAWSISTDSGDATHILEDKGFLIPMQNTWALTRVIEAQLDLLPEDEAGRTRGREENRNHVTDRFGIDRMVQGFHDIWFEGDQ